MAFNPYSVSAIYPPGSMAGRLRRDLEAVIGNDDPYRLVAGLGPRAASEPGDDLNVLDVEVESDGRSSLSSPVDPDDRALDLSGLTEAEALNVEQIGGSVEEKQQYANSLREFNEQAKVRRKEPEWRAR